MKRPILVVCALGIATIAQSASRADDPEFREIVAALRAWQEVPPPATGRQVHRSLVKGKELFTSEHDWYWKGHFRFSRSSTRQGDETTNYVRLDNGAYFASITRGRATLEKWSLQSLILATDDAYQTQQSESWPDMIGLVTVFGGRGKTALLAKLTEAPIQSVSVEHITVKGLDCRHVEVLYDQSRQWHGQPPPLHVTLVVAKDFGWLPVKTSITRSDGVISTAFIDGWHQVDGRWLWSTIRGYVDTKEEEPAKLAAESQLLAGIPPEQFDTKQCYLSFYGIAEPKISRWPSPTFILIVLLPLLAAGGAYWLYAKKWGRA
jgi:hypothetical protein